MDCKDIKTIREATLKTTGPSQGPGSTYANYIPDHKEAREKIKSRAKDEVRIRPRETKLPVILPTPDKAYAIGKQNFVIDDDVFGPSFEERKRTSPTEVADTVRYHLGSYWAPLDIGEGIKFLKNDVSKPFLVEDFDFMNRNIIKLSDVPKKFISSASINTALAAEPLPTTNLEDALETTLITKQWVLIRTNRTFLVPKDSSDNSKSPAFATREPGLLRANVPPKSGGDVDATDLRFSKEKWGGFLSGMPGNMVPGEDIELAVVDPAIKENTNFFDHAFVMPSPISLKELERFGNINSPLFASIEPTYNFNIPAFENNISNTPETMLPNMYVMLSELKDQANNPDFQDHISLIDRIRVSDAPIRRGSRRERGNNEVKFKSGQYFDQYGLAWKQIEQSFKRNPQRSSEKLRFEDLKAKFDTIAVPIEQIDLIDKYTETKVLFPMFVDINFSTDRTTKIAQALKDAKLSTALQKTTIKTLDTTPKRSFIVASEVLRRTKTKVLKNFGLDVENLRTWDISEWLNEFDASITSRTDRRAIQQLNKDVGIFLGTNSKDLAASTEPEMKFFRTLFKTIFNGKLRKMAKQHFRTYEELLSGKLAYNETVMYRVEKRLADTNGNPIGPSIQNFYLPNSNEIDVLKFIDTQVKYGVRYAYQVYAYQVVIGTKYWYSNLTIEEKMATFLVSQEPSIKMIEVPYYLFSGAVLDNPSTAPEISVIPYRGVNNKVLFNLSAGIGDYRSQPVFIQDDDEELYAEIKKSKGLEPTDPIRFRTDDHTGQFQIFRTTEKPKEYSDFSNSLLVEVKTDIDPNSPQTATAASYIDSIKPNKKYYYTFRIKDIHGHFSMPSVVYEIELIDDVGSIYPQIKVIELKAEENKNRIKSGKKFIQITPALGQTLVNEEKSDIKTTGTGNNVRKVMLGLQDKSVWGKTFKIRLTSRKSGKKIDFNIHFKTKFVKTLRQDQREE